MIRERTIHFNGYTEACRLILHGQTPEGLTSRRHIMDKIPTPHLIFCLGRGLERRARHHFICVASAWAPAIRTVATRSEAA